MLFGLKSFVDRRGGFCPSLRCRVQRWMTKLSLEMLSMREHWIEWSRQRHVLRLWDSCLLVGWIRVSLRLWGCLLHLVRQRCSVGCAEDPRGHPGHDGLLRHCICGCFPRHLVQWCSEMCSVARGWAESKLIRRHIWLFPQQCFLHLLVRERISAPFLVYVYLVLMLM